MLTSKVTLAKASFSGLPISCLLATVYMPIACFSFNQYGLENGVVDANFSLCLNVSNSFCFKLLAIVVSVWLKKEMLFSFTSQLFLVIICAVIKISLPGTAL